MPPQNATSQLSFPEAAVRFVSSAATVVVGGIEFSGMSTIVVVPPATAAGSGCLEPLPLGPSRLVHVDVTVHQSRHHHQISEVDVAEMSIVDGNDHPILESNRRRTEFVADHDTPG